MVLLFYFHIYPFPLFDQVILSLPFYNPRHKWELFVKKSVQNQSILQSYLFFQSVEYLKKIYFFV